MTNTTIIIIIFDDIAHCMFVFLFVSACFLNMYLLPFRDQYLFLVLWLTCVCAILCAYLKQVRMWFIACHMSVLMFLFHLYTCILERIEFSNGHLGWLNYWIHICRDVNNMLSLGHKVWASISVSILLFTIVNSIYAWIKCGAQSH